MKIPNMEKKDWKQRLGSYDSWAMNESMFITIDGETIYTLDKLLDFIQQELDKAREEGEIEVLTEIFQTCYQEDSKTLELVEEKLSKLKDNKRYEITTRRL